MKINYKTHLKKMADIFKVFADKNRLSIIWVLASKTKENLSVNEVAQFLGVSQPAATQHIKILKSIKLLYAQKKGPYVYYKIDSVKFREIKNQMDSLYLDAYKKTTSKKNKKTNNQAN